MSGSKSQKFWGRDLWLSQGCDGKGPCPLLLLDVFAGCVIGEEKDKVTEESFDCHPDPIPPRGNRDGYSAAFD